MAIAIRVAKCVGRKSVRPAAAIAISDAGEVGSERALHGDDGLRDDGDGDQLEAVQGAESDRSGDEAVAEGEGEHEESGGKGEAEPGGETAGKAAAQKPERDSRFGCWRGRGGIGRAQ